MKNIVVVFDETKNKILVTTRNGHKKYSAGDVPFEEGVEVSLSEMHLRMEDVTLFHLATVTNFLREDESMNLYVAKMNDDASFVKECKHLLWIPVQHYELCGGLLEGGSSFERLLKEYAIMQVVNGNVKFPDV